MDHPEILAREYALLPSAQAPAKIVTAESDRRKRRTSVSKVKKTVGGKKLSKR